MKHLRTLPFSHSAGPKTAKIALVGDFFREQEALTGLPFQGSPGQELSKMLREAGLEKRDCFQTQVFNLRPLADKLESLCGKKAEVTSSLPPISQGKYILDEYAGEVERLKTELETVSPNLVLALGNVACWALLSTGGITAIRGTVSKGTLLPLKVLPTFHPAFILRNWASRPILSADLLKAQRESLFPEILRPKRTVLINPTLEEIQHYCEASHPILSVDIETARQQITSIGFASRKDYALVVPFLTEELESYWKTTEEEVLAWQMVKGLLETKTPKLFQNGLYDLQYILRMGIRPWNCLHDTMLLHHSLYPEMRKGLGFLGSIYTDESSWKIHNKTTANKREE